MTYTEIKKKWIETITVAETQYDYIKLLESLLQKNNITYDEVEQVEEFNKLNRLAIETGTDVECEYYKNNTNFLRMAQINLRYQEL